MHDGTTVRRFAALLAVAALLGGSLAALAGPAAAAGTTSVGLVPATERVGVGETTTVALVVTNADGGVGAYNATIAVEGDSASITDATVAGDTELSRVRVADDGTSVHVAAVMLDTPQSGSVTIGTVTVEGTATGTSELSVALHGLADENGDVYEVSGSESATVTVAEEPTTGSDGAVGDDGLFGRFGDTPSAPLLAGVALVVAVAVGVVVNRRG